MRTELRSLSLAPLVALSLLASTGSAQCRDQDLRGSCGQEFGSAVVTTETTAGGVLRTWLVVGHARATSCETPPVDIAIGRVHFFEWDGAQWLERAQLLASDTQPGAKLGGALAADGDLVAVSATEWQGTHPDQGAVYLFEFDGASWVERQRLVSPDPHGDEGFGASLAFDAGRLMATERRGAADHIGALTVFEEVAGQWVATQRLAASDGQPHDGFGPVVLSGPLAFVGASGRDDAGDRAGAVYVFAETAQGWQERGKILSPVPTDFAYFGASLAVDGSRLAVGAPGTNDEFVGPVGWSVHLYEPGGGGFVETERIQNPYPGFSPGGLGPMLLDEDLLLLVEVDAYLLAYHSSLYAYRLGEGDPRRIARILEGPGQPDLVANRYGQAIARWQDQLAVSEPGWDGESYQPGRVLTYAFPAHAETFCTCEEAAPCGNVTDFLGCKNRSVLGDDTGANLAACGSASVTADDLRFTSWGMEGGPALLFAGTQMAGGSTGLPLSNGLRCVGGTIVRLEVAGIGPGMQARFGPGLLAAHGFQAGDEVLLQAWYRDSGPCSPDSNLTSALRLVLTP